MPLWELYNQQIQRNIIGRILAQIILLNDTRSQWLITQQTDSAGLFREGHHKWKSRCSLVPSDDFHMLPD